MDKLKGIILIGGQVVEPLLFSVDINFKTNDIIDGEHMDIPYYSKSHFTLYHADCLKVLANMRENSIDMIFADPPYNLSNGGFTCQNGQMVSVNKGQWDVSNGLKKDFEFHLAWIQACRRVLKPNGTIWISGTYCSI